MKETLEKMTLKRFVVFEMFVKVCSKVNKIIEMYFPRSIQLKNITCGSHNRPEPIACKTFRLFFFYTERIVYQLYYVLHDCTLSSLYVTKSIPLMHQEDLYKKWIKDLMLSEIIQLCFKWNGLLKSHLLNVTIYWRFLMFSGWINT